MKISSIQLALAASVFSLVFSSQGLAAQSEDPQSSTDSTVGSTALSNAADPQWSLKATHGKWGVLCSIANPNDCRAAQSQNSSGENSQGRLLQVVLTSEENRTFGVLTLPFGVDLRAGIALKIDEGEEFTGRFMTCLPDGCQSILEFDESTIAQLRGGTTMKVGFRPWGDESNTLVIDVPLDGVVQALAALK